MLQVYRKLLRQVKLRRFILDSLIEGEDTSGDEMSEDVAGSLRLATSKNRRSGRNSGKLDRDASLGSLASMEEDKGLACECDASVRFRFLREQFDFYTGVDR